MIKLIVPKSCTYVLPHESNYFKIHKYYIFSVSRPDWRRFRDFQPYVFVLVLLYVRVRVRVRERERVWGRLQLHMSSWVHWR